MNKDLLFKLDSVTASDSPVTLMKLIEQSSDEIRKLNSLIAELLPYMLNDMTQGLAIGQPPFELGHCKKGELPCPDCQWFEDASFWKKRVDAGEFDNYM